MTPEGLCTRCSATQYCSEHEPTPGEPQKDDLSKAARSLMREVRGMFACWQNDIRAVIGCSNERVLLHWANEIEKALGASPRSPVTPQKNGNYSVRQLADDCLLFAASVEKQGTPWARGCALVLRQSACELRELNGRLEVQRSARSPVTPRPHDLADLRTEIGTVLRQVEITEARAQELPRTSFGVSNAVTAEDWRERAMWLVEVLKRTRDTLEWEHLAHLRAVRSPVTPTPEEGKQP